MLGEKVVYGEGINPEEGLVPDEDPNSSGGSLNIQILKDGVKLVFGERLLFPPGDTEIRKEMLPVLSKIARFILISGYQAYVDGHTNNTPVKSEQLVSNEEISIARAANVRYHLMRSENLTSGAVAINVYGSLLPVENNEMTDGRAKNRRVEIILKNQKYF